MPYQDQFPDFVLDVTIPEGFEDTSYRNEICPSWTDEKAELCLFIDYADPARREFPESPRFTLHRTTLVDGTHAMADLALTDDWPTVLKAIAAHRSRVFTQTMARRIFDKHLNSALVEVQRIVGEQDGGLAGMYGDAWAEIVASTEFTARPYLKAQCLQSGWKYDEFG